MNTRFKHKNPCIAPTSNVSDESPLCDPFQKPKEKQTCHGYLTGGRSPVVVMDKCTTILPNKEKTWWSGLLYINIFQPSPGTSSSSSSTVAIGAFPSAAVRREQGVTSWGQDRLRKRHPESCFLSLMWLNTWESTVCDVCYIISWGYWPCLGRASASLLRLVRLSAPNWLRMPGSISVSCLVSAWPVMVKVLAAREAWTLGLLKWMTVPWFVNMLTLKRTKKKKTTKHTVNWHNFILNDTNLRWSSMPTSSIPEMLLTPSFFKENWSFLSSAVAVLCTTFFFLRALPCRDIHANMFLVL